MTVNDVNWKQQQSFLTLNETECLELEARFVLWVKEVKVGTHEGDMLQEHVAATCSKQHIYKLHTLAVM